MPYNFQVCKNYFNVHYLKKNQILKPFKWTQKQENFVLLLLYLVIIMRVLSYTNTTVFARKLNKQGPKF
jgi:hypothetical protein